MLEVLNKIICSSIMAITGIFIIKKIVNSNSKLDLSSIFLLVIFTTISVVLHPVQYTPIYTIIILLLNIIIFTKIYNLSIEQSTIACCIFMAILIVSDMIVTSPVRLLYTVDEVRNNIVVAILTNLAISILSIEIIDNKFINIIIRKFYSNLGQNKRISNIVFLVLLIICFCYIGINFTNNKVFNETYVTNLIIMSIFIIITCIYIESRNSYKQLSDEYDTLFTYVQNFEDWIEKEQLNRHEYKNQLAIISSLTKDKRVIAKIAEILEDNINIEGDVVHKLKELPKGGLKGLMYYKVALAQKNNLKVEVDVSIKNRGTISSLKEEQIKILCKLLGIYFDNAIEAAIETEEKILSLEVYNIKGTLNIVLSNTYKEYNNFSKRNERGITSKGEGHGNGLYYANNLLLKNRWVEAKQELRDNYYIQILTIKN